MSTDKPSTSSASPVPDPTPDPQPSNTSSASPADLTDIRTKSAVLASSVAPASNSTTPADGTTATVTPQNVQPTVDPSLTQTDVVQPTTDTSGLTAVVEPGTKPEKSGNGGRILKLAIVCLVVLLFFGFIGGTAFAYFSKNNVPIFSEIVELGETAVWNLSSDTSNDAFKALLAPVAGVAGESPFLENMFGNRLTYDELEASLDPSSMEVFKYQVDLSVSVGSTSDEAIIPLGDLMLDLKGEVQGTESDNRFSSQFSGSFTTEGTTLSAAGEVRVIGQDAYVNLATLPQVGFFDLTPIKNKWLHSAGEDASQFIVESEGSDDNEPSEDEILILETILNSPTIAENMTKLPDEIFGSVRAHCFQVDLDQSAYRDLMNEVNEVVSEDERLTAEQIEEVVSEVKMIVVGWCLGRVDHLPYRAHILLTPSDTAENPMDLELNLRMWDYNVPVNIEAPAESEPLDEAMEEIMRSIYDDMPSDDDFGSEFDDSLLYDDPMLFDDSYFELDDDTLLEDL